MRVTFALLACAFLLVPACGGGSASDASLPDAAGPSPSCLEAENHSDFAWLRDNVFFRSCANFTSCHDRTQPAGNLDLTAEESYGNLVSVPSTYFTDWMRVQPNSCDTSYLMVRLRCHSETMAGGMSCVQGPLDGGDLMPPNSAPICQQKVDAICRWIMNGAPNDSAPDAGPPDAGPPDSGP
jgi:hypothetical protein